MHKWRRLPLCMLIPYRWNCTKWYATRKMRALLHKEIAKAWFYAQTARQETQIRINKSQKAICHVQIYLNLFVHRWACAKCIRLPCASRHTTSCFQTHPDNKHGGYTIKLVEQSEHWNNGHDFFFDFFECVFKWREKLFSWNTLLHCGHFFFVNDRFWRFLFALQCHFICS